MLLRLIFAQPPATVMDQCFKCHICQHIMCWTVFCGPLMLLPRPMIFCQSAITENCLDRKSELKAGLFDSTARACACTQNGSDMFLSIKQII